MSQYDLPAIDPLVTTGTQLASFLNAWAGAVESSHAGANMPPYAAVGMTWLHQIAANNWQLKVHTSAGDVPIVQFDPTVLGGVTLPGNVTIGGALSVGSFNPTTIGGNPNFTGNVSIAGSLTTASFNPTTFGGNPNFTGNVSIAGSLTCGSFSPATIGGNPTFSGNVTVSGTLTVANATVNTLLRANQILTTSGSNALVLGITAERARITTGGFFKASPTGAYVDVAGTYHEFNTNQANWTIYGSNSASAPRGVLMGFGAVPNNSTATFFTGLDSSAVRVELMSNGGIRATMANNVDLSDATLKSDVRTLSADDLAALWAAHRDVAWCRFRFADQQHDDDNIGYTAQDIEAKFASVAPWLVESLPDPKRKQAAKHVYTHDLANVAHAVLSDCQRRIEALEAR